MRVALWRDIAWRKLTRAAALVLLLIAAVDILVVDTQFATACSSNTGDSGSTEKPDSDRDDGDCYCCCSHIVLTTTPVFVVAETVETLSTVKIPAPPSISPQPILQPPRA